MEKEVLFCTSRGLLFYGVHIDIIMVKPTQQDLRVRGFDGVCVKMTIDETWFITSSYLSRHSSHHLGVYSFVVL